ncbi:MAG: hypothetical protein QOG75_101 [Mycobacterium sp.]|nr:hypothetical protein [Mycobacterium sp.]
MEGESFEVATEFGVPTALREPADYLRLGYNFQDYDKRLGATWKWLRAATSEQVTVRDFIVLPFEGLMAVPDCCVPMPFIRYSRLPGWVCGRSDTSTTIPAIESADASAAIAARHPAGVQRSATSVSPPRRRRH